MNSTDSTFKQTVGSRLSHAYIVCGEAAEMLAMAAVCPNCSGDKPCKACNHCSKAARRIHPDIIYVEKMPDKREILVDQIRELRKDVIVVPNDSEKKAYVIDSAELMNENAQSALLRILEEPPAHAVFILRTGNPAELLPTVRSRCLELNVRAADEPDDSAAMEMANEFFVAIGHGNAALEAYMFQWDKLDKDAFAEFLSAVRSQAATRLRAGIQNNSDISQDTLLRVEDLLTKAGEMLDLNVNTGHISGMMCANLITIDN